MFKKILKFLGKAGKAASDTVQKSTEFVDDVLEKESIVNTIDHAKDMTGKMAEKAGEYYAKGKMKTEKFLEDEKVKSFTDKAKEFGKNFAESAEEMTDKAMENESVKKTVQKFRETGEKIMHKTDEFIDKAGDAFEDRILGEEE